jgi:hypothetical protein
MTFETAADLAKSPQLVVLDQTTKDEFAPMNQKTRLESPLTESARQTPGLLVPN